MSTIIAKNKDLVNTTTIEDLGISISAGASLTLHPDIFTKYELVSSKDLKTLINAGTITINDGNVDLNLVNSLRHVEFRTDWEERESTTINPPASPSGGDTWASTTDYTTYIWDDNAGAWLGVNRTIIDYTATANSKGYYLKLLGYSNLISYTVTKNITIVGLKCTIAGGDNTHTFNIKNTAGTDIYTFSLTGSNYYYNGSMYVNMAANETIRVFCSSSGNNVTDPNVQIEYAVRYVV